MKFAKFWLISWLVLAAISPIVFKGLASEMNIPQALAAPSTHHWFGTDSLGRDLLFRVLAGSSISLGVSVGAVTLALFIGSWLGALAGYFGGIREKMILGAIDLFLCFPTFFLILGVIAVMGPSLWNLVWVLAVTSWMGVARLAHAEVLSLKEREFILAAKSLGASDWRILWKHLIPNAAGPLRVSAVLALSGAILIEAGLSFLGIGVQPPTPSWGNLMMEGKAVLGAAWWVLFFPGMAVFVTVLCLNILGESLARGRRTDT